MRSFHIAGESEALRAFGRLNLGGDTWQDLWMEITHMLYEPSELSCKLHFTHQWQQSHLLTEIDNRNVVIDTVAPDSARITLRMIGAGTYNDAEALFTVQDYTVLPLETTIAKDSQIFVLVDLTPNRIIERNANRIPHPDGTIRKVGNDIARISWIEEVTRYEFIMSSEFDQVTVGRDAGYLARDRPALAIDFIAEDDTDIARVLDAVEVKMRSILNLLSFLARQWISWFEMRVTVRHESEIREGRRRKKIWARREADSREDAILGEGQLKDGGFSRLLSSLTSSPYQNDLTRAIAYSLSARHEAAVETSYLLVFLALETLINALDRDAPLLLPDLKWNETRSCAQPSSTAMISCILPLWRISVAYRGTSRGFVCSSIDWF
jgi:hypothetical protein